jgi:hypothetical protein
MKISPYMPNSAWTSRSVKAVVTEKLCVLLLLGLPFLTMNHIVADFELHTAIDKMNGYDLLHPPVPVPHRKLYNAKLNSAKMVPEYVKPLNIAGIIKEQIEVLNLQEKVEAMERCLLCDFKDVFQPLPHVNKLPRNVTAKIKLKDAEQTIKTRTYACPQKFCDILEILVQQHLDTGQIRPSSSPHALPALINFKADPSILPHWVNDYRQLN